MIFIERYLLYSVLFLPFALVSGPFLSDFIVSTSGILFLIFLIINKKFVSFLLRNKFFIIFIVWYFYLVFRSIFSEFFFLSLESSLFYFRFGIFSMLVLFLCQNTDKFIITGTTGPNEVLGRRVSLSNVHSVEMPLCGNSGCQNRGAKPPPGVRVRADDRHASGPS